MIEATVGDVKIRLEKTQGLFSPSSADRGTLAMLSVAGLRAGDRVLDLGCGSGLVGIYAAKTVGEDNVIMLDKDENAVESARFNALLNGVNVRAVQSDGFASLNETGFTVILSNPPYQSDFSVAKHFIEKGFNRLAVGGRMLMVTKRRAWYENKLRAVFGGAKVYEIDGYFVFEAEKRSETYASKRKEGKK